MIWGGNSKKLPLYTLVGFDLTTHNSADVDDNTKTTPPGHGYVV
jgi:hypothetical protein